MMKPASVAERLWEAHSPAGAWPFGGLTSLCSEDKLPCVNVSGQQLEGTPSPEDAATLPKLPATFVKRYDHTEKLRVLSQEQA
jgi:hypothetical protein